MTITARNAIPPFSGGGLEAICKVLGDTNEGLSGTEIGHFLRQGNVPDPNAGETKWRRLYDALSAFQNKHQVGNHVIMFIRRAMDPTRYVDNRNLFHARRDRLNAALAMCGYELLDDGRLRTVPKAETIDRALERAGRVRAALVQRNVHADVLAFCKAELLDENFFHAVFEAMKSITAKIRKLSGLSGDGTQLAQNAFSSASGTPLLVINSYKSETQRGEQHGFVNLLKGLYGTIRNPLAHDPRIEWEMTEQDALDILTTLSLIHRKLDGARRYTP